MSKSTRAQREVETPHVDPNLLWNYEFPVPPLNEQRGIVAKIEDLFSELDKGVENLEKAREQLKVYRQAVLKHAFEGKLTAQWRADNKDTLENPEQLLARIKQARSARYDQRLQEWKALVKDWEESGRKGRNRRSPESCLKLLISPMIWSRHCRNYRALGHGESLGG